MSFSAKATGDQTNQDFLESDAKRDGTQSSPRAETVLVAMQQNHARLSRDECLRGRTQLRASATRELIATGEHMCHRTLPRTHGVIYAVDSHAQGRNERTKQDR